jgi:hypothetical protein
MFNGNTGTVIIKSLKGQKLVIKIVVIKFRQVETLGQSTIFSVALDNVI